MKRALPVVANANEHASPLHRLARRRAVAGFALCAALFVLMPACAQSTSPAVPSSMSVPAAEAAVIRKGMEAKFPGMEVRMINKSPVAGLYEVVLADQIIYTDAKVGYLFVGSLYDTSDKTNLTEERTRQLNRVAFDSLPLNLAMRKVKGNGQRRLAVFSDADCPFCARLENELKGIDNVTIYTFLFPIPDLHPDATRKSKQIWCSPEPQKAWDEFFASKKLPDNKGDCPTPVAELAALGEKLRVSATPTLVFADGTMVPGALAADRLEAELARAQAEVTKAAAAKK